jgi:glutaredoxin
LSKRKKEKKKKDNVALEHTLPQIYIDTHARGGGERERETSIHLR